MKKAVSILFLLVLFAISLIIAFSGCISQKRMAKICAKCPIKESTKDSVSYIERLINTPVYISDTNQAHIKSPCELLCDKNGDLKSIDTIINTDKGKYIRIKNKGGKLEITSQIDSLKKIVQSKEIEISRLKETVKIMPADCKLDHVKWYHKLSLWISGIFIVTTALFLFYRLKA